MRNESNLAIHGVQVTSRNIRENGDLPRGVMAFGNGGDRTETTTPENSVCDVLGIDSVWGLGDKVQSSSWLLEKYLNLAE